MTRTLRSLPAVVILVALTAAYPPPATAADESKEAEKRAKIQQNTKVSLGLTGGGGSGEAVEKETGRKLYMRMGTAGVNLGLVQGLRRQRLAGGGLQADISGTKYWKSDDLN